MNTQFDILAESHAQIVIPADALRDIIHEERRMSFERGIQEGIRIIKDERRAMLERPLNKKEAADALGVSVRSLDGMRQKGLLDSMEYNSQVYISQEEIARYKRTHKSRYSV